MASHRVCVLLLKYGLPPEMLIIYQYVVAGASFELYCCQLH